MVFLIVGTALCFPEELKDSKILRIFASFATEYGVSPHFVGALGLSVNGAKIFLKILDLYI